MASRPLRIAELQECAVALTGYTGERFKSAKLRDEAADVRFRASGLGLESRAPVISGSVRGESVEKVIEALVNEQQEILWPPIAEIVSWAMRQKPGSRLHVVWRRGLLDEWPGL